MTQINVQNPQVEQFLVDFARENGIGLDGAVEKLALEHIHRGTSNEPNAADLVNPETDPVILLMKKWLSEVPADPEELRKNDEELKDFLKQLNQNRLDAGEDPLF